MGRATWESLPTAVPAAARAGQHRAHARPAGYEAAGALVVHGVDEALRRVGDRDAWVIGGGEVYRAFLPLADRVERTVVSLDVGGDTRAPVLDSGSWRRARADPDHGWHISSAGGTRYRFETYLRA